MRRSTATTCRRNPHVRCHRPLAYQGVFERLALMGVASSNIVLDALFVLSLFDRSARVDRLALYGLRLFSETPSAYLPPGACLIVDTLYLVFYDLPTSMSVGFPRLSLSFVDKVVFPNHCRRPFRMKPAPVCFHVYSKYSTSTQLTKRFILCKQDAFVDRVRCVTLRPAFTLRHKDLVPIA